LKVQGDFEGSLSAPNGTVSSVGVDGDLGGSLTAASLGSVSVKGDMDGAEITLSQAPDLTLKALGKVTVKGWMKDSSILSAGNIGNVTAGGMQNSSIFAGVYEDALVDENEDGVWDLLDPDADLRLDYADRATIGSLKVSGIREPDEYEAFQWVDSFINSNVAAADIGSLSLFRPATDNEGVPFGAAADQIKKYSVKFGDGTAWTGKNLAEPDPDTLTKDDFQIRLAGEA
jgi:hypothetical protein